MDPQSADPHGSPGGFLYEPSIDQPAQEREHATKQMLTTEKPLVQGQANHQEEPESDDSLDAIEGELPKGDLEFNRLNFVGSRHRENYGAQVGDVPLLQWLAGFGRMDQRFQLRID